MYIYIVGQTPEPLSKCSQAGLMGVHSRGKLVVRKLIVQAFEPSPRACAHRPSPRAHARRPYIPIGMLMCQPHELSYIYV